MVPNPQLTNLQPSRCEKRSKKTTLYTIVPPSQPVPFRREKPHWVHSNVAISMFRSSYEWTEAVFADIPDMLIEAKEDFTTLFHIGENPHSLAFEDLVLERAATKYAGRLLVLRRILRRCPRDGTITLVTNGPEGLSNNLDGWEDIRGQFPNLSVYLVFHVSENAIRNAPVCASVDDFHHHGWTDTTPRRWSLFSLNRLLYAWKHPGVDLSYD